MLGGSGPLEMVRHTRLYTQIAETLLKAIEQGDFEEGERLPQERALAEELGVSRPSVREALAMLALLGVVDIRPGQGTFVRNRRPALRTWMKEAWQPVEEVIGARKMCEEGIVRHLARMRPDDATWAAVEDNLIRTERAHRDHQVETFLDVGLGFHVLLAEASGNPLLVHLLRELTSPQNQPVFRFLNKAALNHAGNRETQLRDHKAIFAAIRDGREEEAAGHVLTHLSELQQFILVGSI